MNSQQAKEWLRSYALKKRRLPPTLQLRLSQRIVSKFIQTPFFRKSHVIALYLGFGSEVLTDSLIQIAWRQNKVVLIPDTSRGLHRPCFYLYQRGDSLQKSKYGPRELKAKKPEFPWKKIDLVVAPGLAFDEYGHRLGYGGGTYDRILARTRQAVHMGLFFQHQKLNSLPLGLHDQALDAVFTEEGPISFLAKF